MLVFVVVIQGAGSIRLPAPFFLPTGGKPCQYSYSYIIPYLGKVQNLTNGFRNGIERSASYGYDCLNDGRWHLASVRPLGLAAVGSSQALLNGGTFMFRVITNAITALIIAIGLVAGVHIYTGELEAARLQEHLEKREEEDEFNLFHRVDRIHILARECVQWAMNESDREEWFDISQDEDALWLALTGDHQPDSVVGLKDYIVEDIVRECYVPLYAEKEYDDVRAYMLDKTQGR